MSGGVNFSAVLSPRTVCNLLDILKSYMDDSPDYHCRLKNDCGDEVYLCFKVEE